MAELTQAAKQQSGIRQVIGALMIGGGVVRLIERDEAGWTIVKP
jgi:hypothetical protein